MILWAYGRGFFPMADSRDGPLRWYSADPRSVLPLDGLRVSRSLRKRLERGEYLVTFDMAFDQVINSCAQPRPYAEDTWINDQIIEVFTQLHTMGYSHSVEAWQEDAGGERTPPDGSAALHVRMMRNQRWRLVGGLYGVSIGAAFFGESMFNRATDASKVCLVHLVEHLRQQGFTLLDTQLANPHMMQFGIVEISQEEYLARLTEAIEQSPKW
jgi:leucyl/phenylalanyl-tRNA--protein transferase